MSSRDYANSENQNISWEAVDSLLPGFDLGNTRKLVGGNVGAYLRMLAQFYYEYSEESVNIVYTLGIDHRREAEKMLHKLKGISGNLGAKILNQACEQLDAQLKEGRYSEENFDKWQAELNSTLNNVGELLNKYQITKAAMVQKPVTNRKASLNELEAILADDGYVEESLLKKIEAQTKPEEKELYEILKNHITAIDYPKARSTLKTLIYMSNATN